MPKDNTSPWFPFYVDDFSSDGKVEAMTTQEVGAYVLLLCKAWREVPPASIPNDDRVLARWARLTPDEWAECRTGVLAAFNLGTDNRYHQKRLRREYDKGKQFKQTQSLNGSKGAEVRWRRHGDPNGDAIGDAIATPMAKNSLSSSPSSSQSVQSTHTHGGRQVIIPKSEEEAAAMVASSGIPPEFAKTVYNQLEGRNWKDGANVQVDNFPKHCKYRWNNHQSSQHERASSRPSHQKRSLSVFELKAKRDLVIEEIKQIRGRGSEDVFGHFTPLPKDKDRYAELQKLKKELAEKIEKA